MKNIQGRRQSGPYTHAQNLTITALLVLGTFGVAAHAQDGDRDHDDKNQRSQFHSGDLVVSRSVYDGKSATVQPGTILPPGCAQTTGGCGAATGATADGTYPFVFNNVIYDPSFGVTSIIFLDQITPSGERLSSLEVPNTTHTGSSEDQLVTSFSSKSELALNLSDDGKSLSFMGYVAPINTIDVSNSNTPGAVDPTDPVGENFYRAVATVDRNGALAPSRPGIAGFGKLRIRFERRLDIRVALVSLAAAVICSRFVDDLC